jgi:prepilin-type N-terminal cleavage/methylation domain-containing protein
VKRIPGFTLIELMVAITIATVVVLAAHRVFTGVANGSKAAVDARVRLDRQANARRWLKGTFLSLDPPFEGRRGRASFTSWQPTSGGWFEPEPTVLQLNGSTLIATIGNERLRLGEGVTSVAFDYLLEPGVDTKWVVEWISPVSAPLAIRLRVAGCGKRDEACVDTLVFLVRERG